MIIRVSGSHTSAVAAEIGEVRIDVEVERENASEAMAGAEAVAAEVSRALAALSTDVVERWHTNGLRTSSWREHDREGNETTLRYRATVEFVARFLDVEALSAFVSAQGSHEGVQVRGIEWLLSDERQRTEQAENLRAAYAEAERRAQVIAQAAGRESLRIQEVQDQDAAPPIPAAFALRSAGGGDEGASLELRPTPVITRAELTATFEA